MASRAVVLVALAAVCQGEVLSRCQLLDSLVDKGIAKEQLADWICLCTYESALNTSAVGGPNKNGSYDFGIFQINSRWWCGLDGEGGDCHIKCSDLVDDDLTDDIACAQLIYSLRGFSAWNAWKSRCKDKPLPDISHCFPTTTDMPANELTDISHCFPTTTDMPANELTDTTSHRVDVAV